MRTDAADQIVDSRLTTHPCKAKSFARVNISLDLSGLHLHGEVLQAIAERSVQGRAVSGTGLLLRTW